MENSLESKRYSKEIDAKLNSKYDAVLVHSYWLSRIGAGQPDFKGSLRTRLATRAAMLLGENAGQIVFAGGHLKGPSYPSTAYLSKRDALNKYKIPQERITVRPEAYGTEEEINIFKELAKENGWKNVALIGFKKHFKSISKFMPEGTDEEFYVSYLAVEDIISKKDNEKVQKLIKRLSLSCAERYYWLYQQILYLGIKAGQKELLYKKSKQARYLRDDDWLTDKLIHKIDIFKS